MFAGMKGHAMARDMIQQEPFGRIDWRQWRVVIETADEGRFEERSFHHVRPRRP
jgi:hypothetical protein